MIGLNVRNVGARGEKRSGNASPAPERVGVAGNRDKERSVEELDDARDSRSAPGTAVGEAKST
jgi:hypothetical protein